MTAFCRSAGLSSSNVGILPLCAAQIAKLADTFQYTGRNTPMQQRRDGRWMTRRRVLLNTRVLPSEVQHAAGQLEGFPAPQSGVVPGLSVARDDPHEIHPAASGVGAVCPTPGTF